MSLSKTADLVAVGPHRIGLFLLLAMHSAMLGWSAFTHSPTRNEPEYLAAGVSHWELLEFNMTKVCPPLVRSVAAIPVVLAAPATEWKNHVNIPGYRPGMLVGNDFLIANGRRVKWLFALARWACISFSLIGAYVCYAWSNQLWGARSALLATTLWCFCPNILAHGALMTPDVGVTALAAGACFFYWKWYRVQTLANALAAGAALGLAVLAKTNALILLGVLPAISCVSFLLEKKSPTLIGRFAGHQAFAVIIAIYVINLGYGFQECFVRLDRYEFVSKRFTGIDGLTIGNRFAVGPLGWVPVPLPKPFVEGIDLQQRDFESNPSGIRTYFRGQWYDRSWWLYYPYVVAVKVPLGIWLLLFGATIVQLAGPGVRSVIDPKLLFLIVPGMALFALTCAQLEFGFALRYVLPAFPYAFIFASGVVREGVRSRAVVAAVVALVVFAVVSSVSCFPHSLAYFNEASGGPRQGYLHVQNGNLDCHQDLYYLESWLDTHPDCKPMDVILWSKFPLEEMEKDRSESFLPVGPQFRIWNETTRRPSEWLGISSHALCENPQLREKILPLKPEAFAGYSIHIYRTPSSTTESFFGSGSDQRK